MSTVQSIRIAFRHRRLILANLAGLAVVCAVISLVLPKWYMAKASILPPEDTGGDLSLLSTMVAQNPLLATYVQSGTPSEILVRIMESRTVREKVVEENDLEEVYRASELETATRILANRTRFSVSPEGVIFVGALARSPERSAAIVNSYIDALDRFNREQRTTRAARTRSFIEGRLEESKAELAKKEEKLRAFEEEYSSVELPEQTKAAIEAASDLLSEITDREVRLDVLRGELTEDHPTAQLLKREIRELKTRVREMISSQVQQDSASIYVALQDIPSIKMEMLRLARELEMESKLYALLIEQYEQARIHEARDVSTVEILDRATPPIRREKPKRTLIVLAGAVLGGLSGLALAFAAEGGGSRPGPRPSSPTVGHDMRSAFHFFRDVFSDSRSRDRNRKP